jgi:hypothetical protein
MVIHFQISTLSNFQIDQAAKKAIFLISETFNIIRNITTVFFFGCTIVAACWFMERTSAI